MPGGGGIRMLDKRQYKIGWSGKASWRGCNLSKDLKEVREWAKWGTGTRAGRKKWLKALRGSACMIEGQEGGKGRVTQENTAHAGRSVRNGWRHSTLTSFWPSLWVKWKAIVGFEQNSDRSWRVFHRIFLAGMWDQTGEGQRQCRENCEVPAKGMWRLRPGEAVGVMKSVAFWVYTERRPSRICCWVGGG